jgi:hypothetical protein
MGGMISVHIWGGGVAQGRWLHGSSQADTSCAVLHSGERWTISHPEALENRSVTLAASPEALGEMSLRTPRSGRATQAHHVGGEGATHTHTHTHTQRERARGVVPGWARRASHSHGAGTSLERCCGHCGHVQRDRYKQCYGPTRAFAQQASVAPRHRASGIKRSREGR